MAVGFMLNGCRTVVFLQVHILLRQGAGPTDCLKASFSAHVFLHMLDEEQQQPGTPGISSTSSSSSSPLAAAAAVSKSSATDGAAVSSTSGSGSSGSGSSKKGRLGWGRGKAQLEPAAAEEAAAAAQPLTGAALVRETWNKLAISLPWGQDPGTAYHRALLERSKCAVDSLYTDFSRQAVKQGWQLQQTMLNPKESRVLRLTPLSA
jgi:hypothetical protein